MRRLQLFPTSVKIAKENQVSSALTQWPAPRNRLLQASGGMVGGWGRRTRCKKLIWNGTCPRHLSRSAISLSTNHLFVVTPNPHRLVDGPRTHTEHKHLSARRRLWIQKSLWKAGQVTGAIVVDLLLLNLDPPYSHRTRTALWLAPLMSARLMMSIRSRKRLIPQIGWSKCGRTCSRIIWISSPSFHKSCYFYLIIPPSIVPSEDAHQSEYVAASDKRREYISGWVNSGSSLTSRYSYLFRFTGSAGAAIITPTSAYLVTDANYWLQAQEQLDENWDIVRAGSTDGPQDWIEWIVVCWYR